MAKRYWLFKTEPDVYSIDDLAAESDRRTYWEGVRNYQARNLLRDEVKKGDGVLFYHSRVKPMCVAGTAKVVRNGYPDPTQFDPKSKYHDSKAKRDDPPWMVVDIELDQVFSSPVTLDEMREMPALKEMMLLRRGARLSIQPVTADEWKTILKRGKRK